MFGRREYFFLTVMWVVLSATITERKVPSAGMMRTRKNMISFMLKRRGKKQEFQYLSLYTKILTGCPSIFLKAGPDTRSIASDLLSTDICGIFGPWKRLNFGILASIETLLSILRSYSPKLFSITISLINLLRSSFASTSTAETSTFIFMTVPARLRLKL